MEVILIYIILGEHGLMIAHFGLSNSNRSLRLYQRIMVYFIWTWHHLGKISVMYRFAMSRKDINTSRYICSQINEIHNIIN